MVTENGRRPWDRREKESEPAYRAFLAWRDQQRRNVAALARQLKKSQSLLWRWHRKHRWAERARAWDAHLQRQWEEQREDLFEELMERRRRRAKELDGIARVLSRAGLSGAREVPLKPEVCVRLAERYARLVTDLEERMLAGEEEGPEETFDSVARNLDDATLHRLIKLARREEKRLMRGGR